MVHADGMMQQWVARAALHLFCFFLHSYADDISIGICYGLDTRAIPALLRAGRGALVLLQTDMDWICSMPPQHVFKLPEDGLLLA